MYVVGATKAEYFKDLNFAKDAALKAEELQIQMKEFI
jgi:hypothetical protein